MPVIKGWMAINFDEQKKHEYKIDYGFHYTLYAVCTSDTLAKMYSTRVNLLPCTSVSRASATTVLATKPPKNRSCLPQRRISNAHCIYVMIKYKNAKMISCFLSYVHECEEGNGEPVCFYVMMCLQRWACHINGSAQDCSFVLNHYISEAV